MSEPINVNPNDTTLWLVWGGDLEVNQNGGLLLAYGWDQFEQRFIRRLLTNAKFKLQDGTPVPPGYLFDTKYGLSFRRRVGENFEVMETEIRGLLRDAVRIDEGVDPEKPAVIEVYESNHRVYIDIEVFLASGESGKIAFNLQ